MDNCLLSAGITLALVCSCSQNTWSPSQTANGGSSSTTTGSGGANGNGGNASKGGEVNAGGATTTSTSNGGAANSSGSSSNGGTANVNGGSSSNPSVGGITLTGGNSTNGGSGPSTGGSNANTGGTSPTNTGGKANAGGSTTTGGTASTGGMSSSTPVGGRTAGGASQVGCSRDGLQAAVNSYLAALKAGDPTLMPTSSSTQFVLNDKSTTLAAGQGHFQYAKDPDFHRDFFDVEACRSFSEVICSTWSHPYVLMVVLTVKDSQISKYYVVETDAGDWSFDAAKYLTRSKQEDWSVIPEADRISRADLEAAARAYFAFWGDKNTKVPWGDPCARLEGGSFGAFDTPLRDTYDATNLWGSCSVGIPDQGFAPQPREVLIDPDLGAVDLLLNLGGSDSHLFRFKKDASLKSRIGFDYGMVYVHTLTVQ